MISSTALKSAEEYNYKSGTKIKKVAQSEEVVIDALLRFY
jgi:hypothetical protein